MELPLFYIDDLIKRALQEDINYIDVTTDYLIDDDSVSNAKFLAKDSGIVCGIDIAMRVFTLLDDTLQYTIYKKDGELVQKGDIIVTFTGKTKAMLKGERTALNLIQHMSGIATATRKCVDLAAGTNAAIALSLIHICTKDNRQKAYEQDPVPGVCHQQQKRAQQDCKNHKRPQNPYLFILLHRLCPPFARNNFPIINLVRPIIQYFSSKSKGILSEEKEKDGRGRPFPYESLY